MKPTAETIFAQLLAEVDGIITHYRDDLLVHSRREILEHPGIQFVHYTRAWGTHLIMLHPADHPIWPAQGEKVPYLFGEADREHIVNQWVEMARYYNRGETSRGARIEAIHHFDGYVLRRIDHTGHAFTIVQNRRTEVLGAWTARLFARELARNGHPEFAAA